MISPMGKTDAQALLKDKRLGRIGYQWQGIPYVLPVNYFYDGEYIYIHSLPGQKIRALRISPDVCLQVDDIIDDYRWRSVIAFGKYQEVIDEQERIKILPLLFQNLPHLTPVESQAISERENLILFRILVDKLTGVSEDW